MLPIDIARHHFMILPRRTGGMGVMVGVVGMDGMGRMSGLITMSGMGRMPAYTDDDEFKNTKQSMLYICIYNYVFYDADSFTL